VKTFWVFSVSLIVQATVLAPVQAVPDPMAPPGYGVSEGAKTAVIKPTWVVNQILISEGRKVAVINGQALQEGESWQGLTLVKIEAEKVVVQEKGKRRELGLPALPASVRQ
jgi:MSHA biogenesis protein MshK